MDKLYIWWLVRIIIFISFGEKKNTFLQINSLIYFLISHVVFGIFIGVPTKSEFKMGSFILRNNAFSDKDVFTLEETWPQDHFQLIIKYIILITLS